MKKTIYALIFAGFLLAGCGVVARRNLPMMPGGNQVFEGDFDSNGEQIYFTGVDDQGRRIPYTGSPSSGGMMMNQRLSCASCHGEDGRGGVHFMHMQRMSAPDIRYKALSGEIGEQEEEGEVEPHEHEEQGDHTHEHSETYDLNTFRKAVVEGEHPNGSPLNQNMPRFQMDDENLSDLFTFIKTLP